MTEQNTNLAALSAAGVAVWLDDLSRERLRSGNLAELIATKSVVGVNTNPTIFASAVANGDAYDQQLRELAGQGADVEDIVRAFTTDDIRHDCDVLRPVWAATGGRDGRVSLEVDPRLAHETDKTVAQAIELWKIVDRPNVMIKIPATEEGCRRSPAPSPKGSRPRVSNDPFSEGQFKTLKYLPNFPDRFESLAHARQFCAGFFYEYNYVHHHSGIAWHTPASVHFGTAETIDEARQTTLTAAYHDHPKRFGHRPLPPQMPTQFWINQPAPETQIN